MSERTSGLHAMLGLTWAYNAFQHAVGAERTRRVFASEYLHVQAGQRVLDIGCGTAEILPHLGPVDYTGFDPNPRYIEDAQRRFPTSRFICSRVSGQTLQGHAPFDLIFAMFVVHHLEDPEAIELFTLARAHLKPGGRLVTIDPSYVEGQSSIARWILGQDRGQYIRTPPAYQAIASGVFPKITVAVRHDLLRIPYSHCIMTCRT